MSNKGWTHSVVNTAGESEREAKSRLFNALEPLLVMTFILGVLWPFAYLFGVIPGAPAVQVAANIMLVAGALYLLFVAPFLHRDTLEAWGLGNPRTLWRMLTQGPLWKRTALGAILLGLFAGLNYANYSQWHEVVDFFEFDKLFPNAGIKAWNQGMPGLLGVFAFGGLLSMLIVTCAIRYDNFPSAFRTALLVSFPLLLLIMAAALLQRGGEVLRDFRPGMWALGVLGYVFWGFVQQLLFSGYFGTRFRKAFAPGQSPSNSLPLEERGPMLLLFSAIAALGGTALILVGIRAAYGAIDLTPIQIVLIALFLAPFGFAYGWFFCVDRKRLLVATLAASCFGLIHIESYGLVAVTWGLGIILVYVFMEYKNRNLVALGFIHGLLGSTFGEMFSGGKSGALEVNYSVGPWNIDDPTLASLIIPMLFIGAYLATMAWCVKHVRETPQQDAAAAN